MKLSVLIADQTFVPIAEAGLAFEAPESSEGVGFDAGRRRDVYLAFKETITNATRHSGCRSVEVAVRIERGRLQVRVLDAGHGFDVASATTGTGLTSLRRRTESLGGRLSIVSSPGAGTEVVLDVRRAAARFLRTRE